MGKENKNLSSLKGANKIRQRVGVMLGSDDIKGVQQTVFEIVSNSIDRFKAGFGTIIKVTKHCDKSYTIQDFADGLPMDWNDEEECYNWELALRTLYAGTNYNISNEDHNGQLGYNGAGLFSSIASSEFATVVSKKRDKIFTIKLKQGRPIDKETNEFVCEDNDLKFSKELGLQVLKVEPNLDNETGTYIHYKPDLDIFTNIDIPIEWFNETFKRQSTVNKGLKIIFYDENTNIHNEYFYENGIIDYLQEKTSNNNLSDILYFSKEGYGRDDKDKPEYKVSFEMAFRFSNEVNFLEYYHNSSYLEYGGSPDKAVKNAFVYIFDKYMKEYGLYVKNEKKVMFVDIQDSLALIINSYSSRTSYENQTKKAITNKFIQEIIQDSIKDFLDSYAKEKPNEFEILIKQILVNKRSREKATATRASVKKQLMELNQKGILSKKIEGLKDCDMKHSTVDERWLILTEGLSPASTITQAYDNRTMGSLGMRGRFISSLKCSVADVLNNEPAKKIIDALGCGIEIPYEERKEFKDIKTFDIDNLRYGNVLITVDADSWGEGIKLSLLAFFYKFFPTLLKQGRIHYAISPRYTIELKKGFTYAYNDEEKENIIKEQGNNIRHIGIVKGIGEISAQKFWTYVLSPEARKKTFVKVKYEGTEEEIKRAYDMFIGEDIDRRKEFIRNNIVDIEAVEY